MAESTPNSIRICDNKVTAGDQTYPIKWLLNETFDHDDWSQRWEVESQGSTVQVNEGELQIRRNDVSRKEAGVTVWYDKDLPKNVIIIADTSTEPGEHACNLNFFIHAREMDGSPLHYGRSGAYPAYHTIPNYLYTLTGGFMSGWTRARRNPGFELVHDDSTVRSEPDQSYQITMIVDGNHLSYFLDGNKLHDHVDENPLPGGRFGLRSWFSNVNYSRIRIGEIQAKKQD
jgi:hypothetical protein